MSRGCIPECRLGQNASRRRSCSHHSSPLETKSAHNDTFSPLGLSPLDLKSVQNRLLTSLSPLDLSPVGLSPVDLSPVELSPLAHL